MVPPRVLLPSLLLLLLISISAATTATASSIRANGLRVDLTRADSNSNFTKLQLIQRAARRSHHRMARLAGMKLATGSVETTVHAGFSEFLMDLAIGTPAESYTATLDTGSDLVWTQCLPCVSCFPQPSPVFDPSNSSSFANLPCTADLCQALDISSCSADSCQYSYSYGDGSQTTQGDLASETFTFGSTVVSGLAFGCGHQNPQRKSFTQSSGLVGLGRGPLSLVSQLGFGKFSYCLTSFGGDASKKSPLYLGSLATLTSTATVQSTPLVKNPSNHPTYYYVNLQGITVGDTLLNIPSSTFQLQEDGSGGVIIDSGTTYTYLNTAAYQLVKTALVSQVNLSVADGSETGLDLCFSFSGETADFPKLLFHFDGADLDVPLENYIIEFELNSGEKLLCLTMLESIAGVPVSIFGNFQQQNIQILYDRDQETLSFMPAQCDQL